MRCVLSFLAAFEGAVKTRGGHWGCVLRPPPQSFNTHFAEEWNLVGGGV